ncbi:hypothetical protein GCM10028827_07700 [Mucilaginibacter myungsuensis]
MQAFVSFVKTFVPFEVDFFCKGYETKNGPHQAVAHYKYLVISSDIGVVLDLKR